MRSRSDADIRSKDAPPIVGDEDINGDSDDNEGDEVNLEGIWAGGDDVMEVGDSGLGMRCAYGFSVDGDDDRKGCCARPG